jgi:glycine hydroxymethyltransferase
MQQVAKILLLFAKFVLTNTYVVSVFAANSPLLRKHFGGINHRRVPVFQSWLFRKATDDQELSELIEKEYLRQKSGVNLIASENIASAAVLQALGSCLTNKYSEGLPFKRYYGGTSVIDEIELLCQERALQLFALNKSHWGVNVQPYSGSVANFAIYTALLKPGECIMALSIPSGGHISHGLRHAQRNASAASIYFATSSYVTNDTNLIDYEDLRRKAKELKPKLIIAGSSSYPRDWDYGEMKAIADEVGAYFMADISHVAGFVAVGDMCSNPFLHCDVVMTTTHKSLRGPRGALIFYRQALARAVNSAVFPGIQGGPHNNNIAAIAAALNEAMSAQYKKYILEVKKNAADLANLMIMQGLDLVTNGTSNHIILWNVSSLGLTGDTVELVFDMCGINVNKNMLPRDTSSWKPSGVRIGLLSMTSRGLTQNNGGVNSLFALIMRSLQVTQHMDSFVRKTQLNSDLSAIASAAKNDELPFKDALDTIHRDVAVFALSLETPAKFGGHNVRILSIKNATSY